MEKLNSNEQEKEIISKKMNIEYFNLSEIKPYENNPRNNEEAVKYVANSIKKFGFKVPIIIDKNNVIVAGHTRFKAAQSLGLESVPVIRADDLTEEQVKAFRIADNKVSEYSTWDYEKLYLELDEIDLDMQDFGFTEYENNENILNELYNDDIFEKRDLSKEIYNVTLSFPVEHKTAIQNWIKKHEYRALEDYIIKNLLEV